ncbi:MAG: hypothetical protein ACRYFR_04570 [Janthinobacterium lividum]
MQTKPHSWASIAAHYQDLTAHGWGPEMLELVQHVISSGASSRLFAFTSLDKLKVSNCEPLENTEVLRIHFDRKRQVFCFAYHATWGPTQPEFNREYPVEKGVEKFDQFLRWIGW